MRRHALLLTLVLEALACAPAPSPACGPSTCSGCCDASGACQPGLTQSACGSFGTSCDICMGNQQCQLGDCVSTGGGAGGSTGGSGGATGGSGGATGGSGGATGGSGGATGGSGGAAGGSAGGGAGGHGGGAAGGAGGGAAGGTGGGTVTCTGGCTMFQPAWTANPQTRPPYGSGASKLAFIDDATFAAGIGVMSTTGSGSPPFVYDGLVFIYDRQGTQVRQVTALARTVVSLAVSPDRTTLAAGSFAGGAIAVVSVDGGVTTSLSHGIEVNALAFSPDGTSLYAGGTMSYFDPPPVRRFDLVNGGSVASAAINSFSITGIIPSADGLSVDVASEATGSTTGSSSLRTNLRASDLRTNATLPFLEALTWQRDPRTGQPFFATSTAVMGVTVPGAPIVAAAPHPTLPKAVTLHSDGMLRLVDLAHGRVEDEIRADRYAYDVAFSPDGQLIIAAGIQPVLAAFSLVPGVRPRPVVQPLCGNGVRDPGEACDGTVTATCADVGYTSGTLGCRADCKLDLTACTGLRAGWSCTQGSRNDGVCDCGCDVPDPDCGPGATNAACERSGCANGTRPALNAPWTCTIDSCANVAPEGRCNGNNLEGCDSGTLRTIYCSSYSSGSSTTGNYVQGRCVARLGAPTCSVPDGQVCIVGAGNFSAYFDCAGAGEACVYQGTAGGLCKPGFPACSDQQPTCLGTDKLQIGCNGGKPIVFDCFALGGSCANGQCVGLWQGADCDGSSLLCRSTLTCTNGTCQ